MPTKKISEKKQKALDYLTVLLSQITSGPRFQNHLETISKQNNLKNQRALLKEAVEAFLKTL